MVLDVTAPGAPVVLEPAARRAECIAQSDVRILVRCRSRAGVANGDYLVRERNVDMEVVAGSVPAVTRWRRNDDVTMPDARVELLEPRHQPPDPRSQRRRALHVSEGNLERQPRRLAAFLRGRNGT